MRFRKRDCPFCDAPESGARYDNSTRRFFCSKCGARGPKAPTKPEALDRWRRRPSEERAEELLRVARHELEYREREAAE